MQAKSGDHIVIKGLHTGEAEHECVVIEARGPDGTPPYLVRWTSSGQEGLFFPGADAMVRHAGPGRAMGKAAK